DVSPAPSGADDHERSRSAADPEFAGRLWKVRHMDRFWTSREGRLELDGLSAAGLRPGAPLQFAERRRDVGRAHYRRARVDPDAHPVASLLLPDRYRPDRQPQPVLDGCRL